MSDQLSDSLLLFKYITKLEFPGNELIYRLLYPQTTRYLCVDLDGRSHRLLESNGVIQKGEQLAPLYRKIRAYERIAGRALDVEKITEFLRINEAEFLLNEISITQPDLESRLYRRLKNHVAYQVKKRFYDVLLLPRLLERSEFIENYLQTNIGQPDASENYFNKLREMIQQINEQTEFVEVSSYFDVLTTLVRYVSSMDFNDNNIILSTYQNYCILLSGFDFIEPRYHHFFRKYQQPPQGNQTRVLQLTNNDITQLVRIHNDLVYTRQ